MTATVYIGAGSNIGERRDYLKAALKALESHDNINVTAQSSLYETEPVGLTDQPPFLNMVFEVKTTLEPSDLLDVVLDIENRFGRKRVIRWGPRTLDLDILLYNQDNVKTEALQVPHPRLQERAFVLIPLQELAPAQHVPTLGQTVGELAGQLTGDHGVVRVGTLNESVVSQ